MKLTVETSLNIPSEVVTEINDHCSRGIPFIIYDDKENYLRCYPMQLRIRTYAGGECTSEEQIISREAFAIRIQTGLMVYKSFFSLEDESPKQLYKGKEGVKLIEDDMSNETVYPEDEYLD